jgi:hypothetical protein
MKRATIAMEDERMEFLTFKPLDGWENQKLSQIMGKIGMTSPHPRAKNRENTNGGMARTWKEERDKRARGFSPTWSHQSGLKVPYLSRLVAPAGKNRLVGL